MLFALDEKVVDLLQILEELVSVRIFTFLYFLSIPEIIGHGGKRYAIL